MTKKQTTNLSKEELAAEARREYYRQYRKKNKKRIAENHKRWREENPEKLADYRRDYWLRKAQERKQAK